MASRGGTRRIAPQCPATASAPRGKKDQRHNVDKPQASHAEPSEAVKPRQRPPLQPVPRGQASGAKVEQAETNTPTTIPGSKTSIRVQPQVVQEDYNKGQVHGERKDVVLDCLDPFDEWCQRTFTGPNLPTDELTIVVLGQTGSGKTAFLNLLLNFPVVMRHGGAGVAQVRDFRDAEFENDVKDALASKTEQATPYQLPLGPLRLRIVDTPGFGDTRGPDIDKRHAKTIVDCIKSLGTVHAITMVMSGRDSRMTAQLRYALSEVCAILPKSARKDIVVVFTNTSSPIYLTFDVSAVSQLVEHHVSPERQIFVENPFVLWERSIQNFGKVNDETMQRDLARAFSEAGANLGRFFSQVALMPPLNTQHFEHLYGLRAGIEKTTLEILTELNNAQERQKQLAKQKLEIQHARTSQEVFKEYTKVLEGQRWVFKDAQRHGTFCGAKDCHSNCHAPCEMPKTFENEKFRGCLAFHFVERQVALESELDKAVLLQFMSNETLFFSTSADSGEFTNKATVLTAPRPFQFKGFHFIAGAFLKVPGASTSVVWAAEKHLVEAVCPLTVTIADQSEQDTCKACGHHRSLHYHDEKVWVQEPYTETVVDEATREKYEEAKGIIANKEEFVKGIEEQIRQCEVAQKELGQRLVFSIRQFEQHGLSRNYALLLQNQKDLLRQHIEATLEGESGADVSALKSAAAELDTQLAIVRRNLQQQNRRNPFEWALAMLGLGKVATIDEVERCYQQDVRRLQPDHFGGNPERLEQVTQAREIMRSHLKNSQRRPVAPCAWLPWCR
mmetsp:Transcript_46666/g.123288  ORF Transcript_46666/g.123288 Transcript_46666/m.123288 type:complete len:786 (+) Transcript_46666:31-2388(+)